MKPIIILIDDDKLLMSYYIRALKSGGFKVLQFYNPDGAFDYLDKNRDKTIAAFILDILMLPGKRYKKEEGTNDGLTTGLLIYRDLRLSYPTTPIVILSNVDNDAILSSFRKDRAVEVVTKLEYEPFEFVDFINTKILLQK